MGTKPGTQDERHPARAAAQVSVHPRGPLHRPWRFALVGCSLGCVALLLGACGGGGSSNNAVAHTGTTTATTEGPPAPQGNAPGDESASGAAQSIKFASCMRSHGEPNFPDSAVTVNPSGGVMFRLSKSSGIDSSSPAFKSAMQACQSLVPHAPSHAGASTGSTNQLLKYVQCMRAHGVPDFPEPNSQGQIMVEVTGGANSDLNPSSPQFQAASQACRSLQPPGLSGF